MIKAWHDQDLTDFSRLRDLLFPLSEALLLETNLLSLEICCFFVEEMQ